MNLYTISLVLHVVTAVVGVGLLGAIPIGARVSRRAGIELGTLARLVYPISRYARVSLLVMLLSGAAMDFQDLVGVTPGELVAHRQSRDSRAARLVKQCP